MVFFILRAQKIKSNVTKGYDEKNLTPILILEFLGRIKSKTTFDF
jgi:hypothetical protein